MEGRGIEASCRVLLVEDTPLNQKLEKAMLEYCGCRVDVAESGQEALRLFDRNRYDLLFMDCQMPGMDGYATTGAIRQTEARNGENSVVDRTPIIALTAYAMEGDREKCLQAGMDDYLSKPFGMEGLKLIVDRWVAARPSVGSEGKRDRGGPYGEIPARNGVAKTEAPLDRSALDRLAVLQTAGKNETLKKIIALYFDQSERLIEALRGAVAGKDAAAMAGAAHTFKSSSACLGAVSLAAMCSELEMAGRNQGLTGAEEILATLEREYPRVRAFLEGYADTRP